MIPKGVMGEHGNEPMILMGIIEPMAHDDRWLEIPLKGLEMILDILSNELEIAILEIKYFHLMFNVFKERSCAYLRLGFALSISAEDGPPYFEIGKFASKPKDSPATANLDVVGMCPQTEQPQRLPH